MWVDHAILFEIIPRATLFLWMTSRTVESRINGVSPNGKPIREVNVFSLDSLELQAKALHLVDGQPAGVAPEECCPDLSHVPEHHIELALVRIAACREALAAPRGEKAAYTAEAASKVGITPQQLYRDLARYKKAAREGKNLLEAMLPKWRGPGRPKALPSDLEARVQAEFLKPTRPAIAKVHRALAEWCEERGIGAPSYGTVRRIVADIPGAARLYHRKGKEKYRKTAMPKIARDYTPLRVNELWCGDHHQLDLFIRHRGRLLRPWITAWQDLKTRAITGFHISVQPNSWTIALAFRHAVLPKPEGDAYPMMGAPERVYIDNGRDFTSHHFGGAQKRFKVDFNSATRGVLEALRVQRVTHARPYTPWSKTVERWFGTLTRDLIQDLPGWCGDKPENRPEKLERELVGAHLLTMEEVRGAVVEWLIRDYHARPHRGQGMGGKSPLEVWLGTDRVIREFDPKVLDLLLMKAENRTIRPDGIHLGGHRYWADELALHVGERIDARHSPDEVGRILVFRGRQFLCEAFAEKLYTFNASEQDLKAIRTRQKRAERNLMEAREELVARAAEPDETIRYFEKEQKTEAAAERIAAKETRLRMLSEMEAVARKLDRPKPEKERLRVWDDEFDEEMASA